MCIAFFLLTITPRFCCNYANYIARVMFLRSYCLGGVYGSTELVHKDKNCIANKIHDVKRGRGGGPALNVTMTCRLDMPP